MHSNAFEWKSKKWKVQGPPHKQEISHHSFTADVNTSVPGHYRFADDESHTKLCFRLMRKDINLHPILLPRLYSHSPSLLVDLAYSCWLQWTALKVSTGRRLPANTLVDNKIETVEEHVCFRSPPNALEHEDCHWDLQKPTENGTKQ